MWPSLPIPVMMEPKVFRVSTLLTDDTACTDTDSPRHRADRSSSERYPESGPSEESESEEHSQSETAASSADSSATPPRSRRRARSQSEDLAVDVGPARPPAGTSRDPDFDSAAKAHGSALPAIMRPACVRRDDTMMFSPGGCCLLMCGGSHRAVLPSDNAPPPHPPASTLLQAQKKRSRSAPPVQSQHDAARAGPRPTTPRRGSLSTTPTSPLQMKCARKACMRQRHPRMTHGYCCGSCRMLPGSHGAFCENLPYRPRRRGSSGPCCLRAPSPRPTCCLCGRACVRMRAWGVCVCPRSRRRRARRRANTGNGSDLEFDDVNAPLMMGEDVTRTVRRLSLRMPLLMRHVRELVRV